LLGHGLTLERFRSLAPAGAEMGITLSMAEVKPWSDHPANLRAAALSDGEQNRVFLDPLFKGSYPEDMSTIFPTLHDDSVVRAGDLGLISGELDFLGVNYYLNQVVKADPTVPVLGFRAVLPHGPMMDAGIAAVPEDLAACIIRVHDEYRQLPIYVTEVGAAYNDYVDPSGAVNDPERTRYLQGAVGAIDAALARGVDVRGLFVWSLLDNLEWEQGYSVRFGLFYVDFGTQARIPKGSAFWYKELIAAARMRDPVEEAGRVW
jgi:beta-glucosidase